MSKLPKISAHNSDSLKSALGWMENNNSANNTVNGGEKFEIKNYKDKQNEIIDINENYANNSNSFNINNYNLPPINNQKFSYTNTGTKENNFNSNKSQFYSANGQNQNLNNTYHSQINPAHILITDSKINDIETKLISLEQTNSVLREKLFNHERNLELQYKSIQQALIEEKDNRGKFENLLRIVTDQSSVNSSELKNRMNLIQEVVEKEEKWKYEQRQHDIELYKNLISKLTDKVSETVKLEIDARFKADMDNKALTQNIAQKIYSEFDTLRKDMEELNENTKLLLKDNSKDCSERAHNLSKYIDTSINEATLPIGQNFEKLKNFTSKLADQIRTNMSSQNIQNKIYEEKILGLENFNSSLKEEIYKFVSNAEDRLIRKNKELQNFTEVNMRRNFEVLNSRINELSFNTDKNISIISGQLLDTRNKLNLKLDKNISENKIQFNNISEDLENIVNRVYNYESLLQEYDNINQLTKIQIDKNLSDIQSKFEVNLVNEKILHRIEYDEMTSTINTVKEELEEFSIKVDNNITELMKNFEMNYLNLFERSKLSFDQMNKMAESNIQMFDEIEATVQKIHEENDKIEINNLMNKMLSQIEQENTEKEIEKCKISDIWLKNNLDHLEVEISRLNYLFNENNSEKEVRNLMNEILLKVEKEETDKECEEKNKKIFETLDNLQIQILKNSDEKEIFEKDIQGKFEMNNSELLNLIEEFKIEKENWRKLYDESNEKRSEEKVKLVEESLPDTEAQSSPLQEKITSVLEHIKNKLESKLDNIHKELDINSSLIQQAEVKSTMDGILTKLEIQNLYSVLTEKLTQNEYKNAEVLDKLTEFHEMLQKMEQDFSESNETTKKVLNEYNQIIENKIGCALEKIKNENMNMWVNAVEMSQKINQPDGKLSYAKFFILKFF
jgi:hypothetical protein